MSKNNKEKSSFWKKLGLGKNKTSVSTSSLKSEADRNSVKSKRLSSGLSQLPLQQQNEHHNAPPLPIKAIQKQPRVDLPKAISHDSIALQQHVDTNHQKLDISYESIVTPTADEDDNNKQVEQKESALVYSTEQPNVTPTTMTKKNSSTSDSSFVVVKSNDDINTADDINKNQELLTMISNLKTELENEKATVNVLQKQKEAVTKDLDYFELTVDELLNEKTDLLQQLEDEKIKNQHYLDDLNLSLEKQKATADNARDQSFAVDQTKLEFEATQEKWRQDQSELLSDITSKDKTIRELRSKLSKSQEQVETLKSTMDQLIKSHTEEMTRTIADKEKSSLPLHTPNGSPRIHPNKIDPDCQTQSSPIIPLPTSSTPFTNSSMSRTESTDQTTEYNQDLDDQLMKLTKEKEKLASIYSKIPLTGSGPQFRRRKEELEAMLDQVDSQLSKVKQKIRRS
ncbi:hypothetical protein MFLAVUS_002403 [Mucor flavus]|uniref:Enkurin domain-containing protein n=1 Tax=Mucor flavus TaxID=439312 RepID=A0ABP9YQA7_9FUNG